MVKYDDCIIVDVLVLRFLRVYLSFGRPVPHTGSPLSLNPTTNGSIPPSFLNVKWNKYCLITLSLEPCIYN